MKPTEREATEREATEPERQVAQQEPFNHKPPHMALMWYTVAMLPAVRRMTAEELETLTEQVQALSQVQPLHLMPEARFEVPAYTEQYEPGKKLTGGQVIVLMVCALWVKISEREEHCPELMRMHPYLRDAVAMLAATVGG